MLTKERAEQLTNYLTSDEERGQRLVTLSVDEAVAEINRDGLDFTAEELQEYAEGVTSLIQNENGELDAEQLENVAGGFGWAAAGLWALKLVCGYVTKKGLDYFWDKYIGKRC